MTRQPARPPRGEPAPLLELNDANGNVWRSEDHHGRTIVVIFHRHIH